MLPMFFCSFQLQLRPIEETPFSCQYSTGPPPTLIPEIIRILGEREAFSTWLTWLIEPPVVLFFFNYFIDYDSFRLYYAPQHQVNDARKKIHAELGKTQLIALAQLASAHWKWRAHCYIIQHPCYGLIHGNHYHHEKSPDWSSIMSNYF